VCLVLLVWCFFITVGAESIHKTIFNKLIYPKNYKDVLKHKLMLDGADLYLSLPRYKLKVQMRAREDENHCQYIEAFADTSKMKPVDSKMVGYFRSKVLKAEHFQNDINWLWAPVLTTCNLERCVINMAMMERYAIWNRKVLVKWKLSVSGLESLTLHEMNQFYEENPEYVGLFVKGAPCALNNTGIKSRKSLVNGLQGHMAGLVFSTNDKDPLICKLAKEAVEKINKPVVDVGDEEHVIWIDVSPCYFLVEVSELVGKTLADNQCIRDFPGVVGAIIPVPENNKKNSNAKIIVFGSKNTIIQIQGTCPMVDPGFSFTFNKAQGKTMSKVVLCLHENKYMKLRNSDLYVGLSRVNKGSDLAIFPWFMDDLDRLKGLQHDLSLVLLDNAYDEETHLFSETKYRELYEKLKIQGFVKKKRYENEKEQVVLPPINREDESSLSKRQKKIVPFSNGLESNRIRYVTAIVSIVIDSFVVGC